MFDTKNKPVFAILPPDGENLTVAMMADGVMFIGNGRPESISPVVVLDGTKDVLLVRGLSSGSDWIHDAAKQLLSYSKCPYRYARPEEYEGYRNLWDRIVGKLVNDKLGLDKPGHDQVIEG